MGNQISLLNHTNPGEEVITTKDSHIKNYEHGAASFLSRIQFRNINHNDGDLDLNDLISQISKSSYYKPKISTVAIENTHLASGGTIIPFQKIKQLSEFTKSNDLKLHVDGARVWHAILEEKTKNNYGKYCDSLTFCFSKGLGAPIGSMLLGSKDFIANSREYRKKIGGGMRQVGIIASAAKYALENRSTLILDHQMAKDVFNAIENVVNKIDCIESVVYKGTNMILLNFDTLSNSDEFLRYLSDNDIKAGYLREKVIRFVFHKDITSDNKEKLIETVQSFS
jgi:threonine aldolase